MSDRSPDELTAELRATIQFLERSQEVAHVGSWVAELDGSDRVVWSAETYRIFGIGPGAFAQTRPAFYALVHPDDLDEVVSASEASRAGTRTFDIEHRIVAGDGVVRWVHERADVVRDHAGVPLRMIGTVQDVTERRRLEEQLRQAQKMEAMGRLAGGIAHDLNNALTLIAGYTELTLGELDEDHPARSDIQEIRRAADRASSVTRQLLAFSRKQVLEPRVFDVNETIRVLGKLLDRLLGDDIALSTSLAPGLPRIHADPGQIEQAIINLAVNARDAMPRGGALTLETQLVALDGERARAYAPVAAGEYVELRVSDTGQGMSLDTQTHIFEPFFTTKEPGKGTGLGLAMVYGTVKQSGGFIFVESESGRGTTFRMYFPPARPRGERPSMRHAGTGAVSGPSTVLVIEDEPSVRSLVIATLTPEGHRVLEAASAEDASAILAAQGHVDLVLADANLPGESGVSFARRLRTEHPSILALLMSGYTEELNADDGISAIPILQKPFTPRELRRTIRDMLNARG